MAGQICLFVTLNRYNTRSERKKTVNEKLTKTLPFVNFRVLQYGTTKRHLNHFDLFNILHNQRAQHDNN